MTDYTVSAEKLQELNVLIDQGGHIPSEVNAATGETARQLGIGNIPGAQASNFAASKANDKSGGAWSAVQAWHDSVKASAPPVEPPVPPPGPNPGAIPETPIQGAGGFWYLPPLQPDGKNHTFVGNAGAVYVVPLPQGAQNNASFSFPSGSVRGAVDAAGVFGANTSDSTDQATIFGPFAPGLYLNMTTNAGHSAQGTVTYSAVTYG